MDIVTLEEKIAAGYRLGYDEAVELIKRNSRRYAKRQLTWFRRDPEIFWTPPGDTDKIIAYIDGTL